MDNKHKNPHYRYLPLNTGSYPCTKSGHLLCHPDIESGLSPASSYQIGVGWFSGLERGFLLSKPKNRLLMGGGFGDLIFFELVVKGASADTQTLGRLLFIPAALL